MHRILLADDDRQILDQLEAFLSGEGYRITAVADGVEAFKKLESEEFDLAILDNMMPGMKGLEILERQRVSPKEVPVIILTAFAIDESIVKAKELGSVDFIAKPFNQRDLLARVNAVIKKETRIACLGGGTGLYNLLLGLKAFPGFHLASVVNMSDDGGSTGRLRTAFGILPPGDVRRSLVALSTAPDLMKEIIQHRFGAEDPALKDHNFGNLFLAALSQITGSMEEAIRAASDILNIRGIVIPVTTTKNTLMAELEDGTEIIGEANIDVPHERDPGVRITKLWQEPEAVANPNALSAVVNAEYVIIGPGDLFTSIVSNLVVKGIKDAVQQTKGKVIYICNLMTKPGETLGYSVEDHVGEIIKYAGEDCLDYVLVSSSKISKKMLDRYAKKVQAPVVIENTDKLKKITNAEIIEADVGSTVDLVRHDSIRLASEILRIIRKKASNKR